MSDAKVVRSNTFIWYCFHCNLLLDLYGHHVNLMRILVLQFFQIFGLVQACLYGFGLFLLFIEWKAMRPVPPPRTVTTN